MSAAVCTGCAEVLPKDARFCEGCGTPVGPSATTEPAAPPCASCGSAEFSADGYCAQCGMKQPSPHDRRESDLGALAAVTDRGLRHHRNEDAFAIDRGGEAFVLVVCDGVSSTADADIAAQRASFAACSLLRERAAAGALDHAALHAATAAAQGAAASVPRRDGAVASCTFVAATAALAPEGDVVVRAAWLGDSRAYAVGTDGALVQLSRDDSYAAELIDRGTDVATAMADPQAHTITRWLGADATDTTPRVAEFRFPAPVRLVLCSDGLWNYAASLPEMQQLLDPRRADAPIAAARTLTEYARQSGGHDNITVAIADIRKPGP